MMPVAEAVDPLDVLAALGVAGPERATRISGGADTQLWRIDLGDAAYALRLFRPEQAATAAREITAMRAAMNHLPVPQVVATGTWRERPAHLLGWCPGRPLLDELRARPWRAWSLGVRFGQMQAAIHAVPAPADLVHPVSWQDWAPPDEALRACLQVVPPRPPALLHLDFHPLNVMTDGAEITGVLDWANARTGDPRADVARTGSILALSPVPRGDPLALVRRLLVAGWRRGYEAAAGPIGDLAPFAAWAGAVMMRDLAPRVGRADLPWLTPDYLKRIERWTFAWRERAGCPS